MSIGDFQTQGYNYYGKYIFKKTFSFCLCCVTNVDILDIFYYATCIAILFILD